MLQSPVRPTARPSTSHEPERLDDAPFATTNSNDAYGKIYEEFRRTMSP